MPEPTKAQLQEQLDARNAEIAELRAASKAETPPTLEPQQPGQSRTVRDVGSKVEPQQPRPTAQELGNYSGQAAQQGQAFENEAQALDDEGVALVALPNGGRARLSDYLDAEFFSGDHSSIFASPSRFMREPKPGHMYVWAAKYAPKGDKANPHTVARIRTKEYRPVPVSEIREDCDLPVEADRMAGQDVASMYDLVLMEVPPAAVKRLYRWREANAVTRSNRMAGYQELKSRVSAASRGQAVAEVEIRP